MNILDSINKALVAKERENSAELQDIRKKMKDLNDEREGLESDNKVLTTMEIRSNNELRVVRKTLIDVSEQLVTSSTFAPHFIISSLIPFVIDLFQQSLTCSCDNSALCLIKSSYCH